ncbi:leucyl aminopeptidase [Paramagnetospirillum kuznetsovii]|uniref:Probable cytosol aminopeptidase n=1 Tax=Paramagnetospirillum kuznetsovii TaxID=2053833 RepID=A0A364P0F2_9PROT|nr:leucyl aminopeptidase [Paramagnetospirillum kuznetsovii]RAU22783.1 leucyl aminopeptidase [Paramagnetospirillum kuznetsovii]
MKIAFSKPSLPTEGAIAVGVLEGKVLCATAQRLDDETKAGLTRAVETSRFEGKKGQTLMILAPAGLSVSRVLLVGLGKAKDVDAQAAQAFGGTAVAQVLTSGETDLSLAIDAIPGSTLALGEFAANAAFGALLRSYRFDKYMTKQKKEDKPSVKKLAVMTAEAADAKSAFAKLEKIATGVFLTRDVVSEPANIIHPESLAAIAEGLKDLGVEVEVLGEKQMRKLGMGALLGVGQGSERESKLVVMRWQGSNDKNAAPVAFIGKGVTFDSGGISIKPSGGMEDMKWDMAGAGAVIGAMAAMAGRKAKVNAVGVVGLVENMPSGTAQRPGDVVTSMSGQTIEVINTDAEGRLVLADALWYTQDRFKPKFMIDLATLTGAIIISLGHEFAGLFASDDKLADRIAAAGKSVGEQLWRLPMGEAYDKQIKSDIADMKNVGGREGGSITAAQFLKRFTNDVDWAHLDIAGMAWSKKDTAITPKGATAFGVRLLDRLVADYYEDKAGK